MRRYSVRLRRIAVMPVLISWLQIGGRSIMDRGRSAPLPLLDEVVANQEEHTQLSKKYTEIVTTGKVDVGGPDRKYAYGFGDSLIDGRR